MANSGQSICFVMTPCEDEYITHMKKVYAIEMHNKSRFTLARLFEQKVKALRVSPLSVESMSLVEFRQLTQIEDLDERQESLHAVRQMLTKLMLDESKGLQEMARVARSSSTRAYAGHSADFRHIFEIKSLNLTEYARSFGIYKIVHENMTKSKWIDHRDTKKMEQRANQAVDANEG